ncbi:hypothetical protein CPB84DRAFT_1778883, partial [Gymnopilus junonius]
MNPSAQDKPKTAKNSQGGEVDQSSTLDDSIANKATDNSATDLISQDNSDLPGKDILAANCDDGSTQDDSTVIEVVQL